MRVAVIGTGLAGLRTAMLLERAGIETVLFEARSRTGGQVDTIADASGPLYDAGGEWIDADHARMFALAQELDATLVPPTKGDAIVIHGSERTTEADLWEDAIVANQTAEGRAKELAAALNATRWHDPGVLALDTRTLDSFLRNAAKSDRSLFWLTAKYRADEGEDTNRVGLLGWLAGYRLYATRAPGEADEYRIANGMGDLCARMEGRLAGHRVYGRTLHTVRQDKQGVSLVFPDEEVRVDRVVLTLPPSCLKAIEFDPPLSRKQRDAIAASCTGRAIKISLAFHDAWWRDAGMSGSITADGPLQCVWDASIGDTPILNAYICGDAAATLVRNSDPVAAAVEMLSSYFPAAGKSFATGQLHDWISDPFARGGFSYLPPGFVTKHVLNIATPAGRIHFAGEHTAAWRGYLEGALESAERAAREIQLAM